MLSSKQSGHGSTSGTIFQAPASVLILVKQPIKSQALHSQPNEPYLRTIAMLCIAALVLLLGLISTSSRSVLSEQAKQSSALLNANFVEDYSDCLRHTENLLHDPQSVSARSGLQRMFYQYVALAKEASAKGDTALQNMYLERAMNVLEGRILHPTSQLIQAISGDDNDS